MPLIEACKVKKLYAGGQKEITVALQDFSLYVGKGEFITIVGPSGCGKTTFLLMVAGLEPVSEGSLLLDGKPVNGPDPERALVFQDCLLFPWRTVRENVEFGPEVRGLSKQKRGEVAAKYIELVRLAGFENSYPNELSGGMKQKAAIARALANEPKVILMDEPFASLDALSREMLQLELLRVWEEAMATILFVTHSIEEAVCLSDRVMVMSKRPGRIKETVSISLPRPRTRETFMSLEFIEYERRIRRLVWEEFQDHAG